MTIKATITGAVLGAGLAATAALAHHGFGGSYDRSAPVYLEGTVQRAYFGQPHAELVLTVDAAVQSATLDETAQAFADGLTFWRAEFGASPEIELPPVRLFFDLETRVRPGDRIAIIALRNCDPPHQLRAQWIAPPAGEPVVRRGRMQTEVSGC